MQHWVRIVLAVLMLLGGTLSFGYWSLRQFDTIFDNLDTPYVANTLTASSSFKEDADGEFASREMSDALATPTDGIIPPFTATTTTASTTPVTATSTDLEFSFTFPQKGDEVYIGCTYPISWQSSTTVQSLETALIDAGTRKPVGPIASGLARGNIVEQGSQNLKWQVGIVWPGEYFIELSKINGVEVDFRSKVFETNKIPAGMSEAEKTARCQSSGGVAVF